MREETGSIRWKHKMRKWAGQSCPDSFATFRDGFASNIKDDLVGDLDEQTSHHVFDLQSEIREKSEIEKDNIAHFQKVPVRIKVGEGRGRGHWEKKNKIKLTYQHIMN